MMPGMSLRETTVLRIYAATISATCSFIPEPFFMKADAINFKNYPQRERPAISRVMDIVAS
jgi:hypothetical protein